MQTDVYQQELDAAIEAVREAARLCRTVQAGLSPEVLSKKDRSPVTVADFGSQALVCRRLQAAFPDDPVVAEEDAAALRKAENEGVLAAVVQAVKALRPDADAEAVCRWIDHGNADGTSRRFWTLDPIDGTKGFLRGEQYAVALALIEDGALRVAALACPNLGAGPADAPSPGMIYAAVSGGGAVCVPVDGDAEATPVRVSPQAEAAGVRFCESVEAAHSSHGDAAAVAELLGIEAEPVRLDSQAKYAVVARGDAEIYLRLPTRPGYVERIWDHAAGALVITEAGGRVTDVHGRPLSFRHGKGLSENRGVVATNGLLHDRVLAALETVGVAAPVE